MSHQDWLTYESFQQQQKTMLKAAENARLAKEAQKDSQKTSNFVLSALKTLQRNLSKQPKAPVATYSPEPSFES